MEWDKVGTWGVKITQSFLGCSGVVGTACWCAVHGHRPTAALVSYYLTISVGQSLSSPEPVPLLTTIKAEAQRKEELPFS